MHTHHPSVLGKPPFVAFLMGEKGSNSHLITYFHITAASLTVLFMTGSAVFVRFSRRSTPTPANAPTTIVNTIPFSNLNTSIALTIAVHIISNMLGVTLVMGVHGSLILATLLSTNKGARKHLQHRLRQNVDSLTIGRSVNLRLHLSQKMESLGIGRSHRVEPAVSVALVPIRDFRGIQ